MDKQVQQYQKELEMWEAILACQSFAEMNVIFGNHGAHTSLEIDEAQMADNLAYYQNYAAQRVPEIKDILDRLEWMEGLPDPLPPME